MPANLALKHRLKYFNRGESVQNFGDYVPQLFEDHLILQPRVQADIYRLIGSVIDAEWILRDLRHSIGTMEGTVAYWGCGMRSPRALPDNIRKKGLFFGVRGPRTRDLLGLDRQSTPLGDPALLLPILYTPSSHQETQGRSICIPHVHDPRPDRELLLRSGADLIVRPTIEASERALLEMIDKIWSAKFVLTNALHGAIFAAAYARPFAFWSNGHLDCPLKWDDFAASINMRGEFAEDLQAGLELYGSQEPDLHLPPLTALLACCPFEIRPKYYLQAALHDSDISPETGRSIEPAIRLLETIGRGTGLDLDQVTNAFIRRQSSPLYQAKALVLQRKEAAKLHLRRTYYRLEAASRAQRRVINGAVNQAGARWTRT